MGLTNQLREMSILIKKLKGCRIESEQKLLQVIQHEHEVQQAMLKGTCSELQQAKEELQTLQEAIEKSADGNLVSLDHRQVPHLDGIAISSLDSRLTVPTSASSRYL
jgi:hypothetical protein